MGWDVTTLSGPLHHGMARPQVPDGGLCLQIWRVATNILNKQSRTDKNRWSSSLGLGVVTIPHFKKQFCYKISQRSSDLHGVFALTV
jgi:hypothetical protein